jgi:hypothetical protein
LALIAFRAAGDHDEATLSSPCPGPSEQPHGRDLVEEAARMVPEPPTWSAASWALELGLHEVCARLLLAPLEGITRHCPADARAVAQRAYLRSLAQTDMVGESGWAVELLRDAPTRLAERVADDAPRWLPACASSSSCASSECTDSTRPPMSEAGERMVRDAELVVEHEDDRGARSMLVWTPDHATAEEVSPW